MVINNHLAAIVFLGYIKDLINQYDTIQQQTKAKPPTSEQADEQEKIQNEVISGLKTVTAFAKRSTAKRELLPLIGDLQDKWIVAKNDNSDSTIKKVYAKTAFGKLYRRLWELHLQLDGWKIYE